MDLSTTEIDRQTFKSYSFSFQSIKGWMVVELCIDSAHSIGKNILSCCLCWRIYTLEEGMISEQGIPEDLALADNLFSRSLEEVALAVDGSRRKENP